MKATIKCPVCKKKIVGRSDKKYCSMECKNAYHGRLRNATLKATERIDKILHRNRSILLEVLLHKKKMSLSKDQLEDKGFQFKYCTGVYYNTQNKLCFYIYDYMWYELRDRRVYVSKI